MTPLDQIIARRNDIQLRAERDARQEIAEECWTRLDVANRCIRHLLNGDLELTLAVENEIRRCLDAAEDWLKSWGMS